MRLPSAYQEVEYIESSWTQWIDTWLKITNATSVKAKTHLYYSTLPTNERDWLGTLDTNSWFWFWNNSSWYPCIYSRQIWYGCVQSSKPQDQEIECFVSSSSWWYHTMNWTKVTTSTNSTLTWTENIVIFNNDMSESGRLISCRMYYLKIDVDWTTVRNYTPCYRKSDDVIWMYDTVNNAFYTNSWTGTFTKGANVEYPPEYKLHWAIQTFHRAPKPPTSITLNESAIIFSAVWDTQQLAATVSPGDASTDFIWSSNDTSIATVSNTWLVTCVSLWNCVITCTAKYWSATASCSVINPENVTMTNTSYSQWASYSSLTETLFTASETWYYHITWQFYSNASSSWATWAIHSLSWWTKISWTDSGWVDPYKTLDVDCVYYIESWTDFKGYVETYGYTSWWWRNFAAEFWWDYDPSQSSNGWWGSTSGAAIQ